MNHQSVPAIEANERRPVWYKFKSSSGWRAYRAFTWSEHEQPTKPEYVEELPPAELNFAELEYGIAVDGDELSAVALWCEFEGLSALGVGYQDRAPSRKLRRARQVHQAWLSDVELIKSGKAAYTDMILAYERTRAHMIHLDLKLKQHIESAELLVQQGQRAYQKMIDRNDEGWARFMATPAVARGPVPL